MNEGEEQIDNIPSNNADERKISEPVEEIKQKNISKNDNFERLNDNDYGKKRSLEFEDVLYYINYRGEIVQI
jgi:hypothetical protein